MSGQNPPRSSLVTAAAWAFIVLSALELGLCALRRSLAAGLAVPLAGLLTERWPGLLLADCLFSAARLVLAAALLLRKRWSRAPLALLLALGALRAAAGAAAQAVLLASHPSTAVPEGALKVMAFVLAMLGLVASAGLAVVYLWVASRLCAPDVRAEFEI